MLKVYQVFLQVILHPSKAQLQHAYATNCAISLLAEFCGEKIIPSLYWPHDWVLFRFWILFSHKSLIFYTLVQFMFFCFSVRIIPTRLGWWPRLNFIPAFWAFIICEINKIVWQNCQNTMKEYRPTRKGTVFLEFILTRKMVLITIIARFLNLTFFCLKNMGHIAYLYR